MSDRFTYKKGRGEFIDPEDVGSFVRYKIAASVSADRKGKKSGRIDMDVGLGDCNRSINWGIWCSDEDFAKNVIEGKAKLRRAIAVLDEAYFELTKAAETIRKQKSKK